MKRVLAAVLLCALASAGCLGGASEDRAGEAGGGGEEDGDLGAPTDACHAASDCMPAASTCCGCPTFAVPSDGEDQGCGEIECQPGQAVCSLVEAVCDAGRCALVCAPVITSRVCETGFERDELGCLVNRCDGGPTGDGPAECVDDGDCARVPADCCGCARGGADTAVAASELDAHLESLDCAEESACPEVDVCSADEEVRCRDGGCVLVTPPADGGSDAMPCGTLAHPVCDDGFVCVLNAPDASDADALAVGSCQPR